MKHSRLGLGLLLVSLLVGCDLKALPTGVTLPLATPAPEEQLTRSGIDELIRLHEEGLVNFTWKNTDHYTGHVTEFLLTAQTLKKIPLRSVEKFAGTWKFPSHTTLAGELRLTVDAQGTISGEIYHLGPWDPVRPRELFKTAGFEAATFKDGLLVVKELKGAYSDERLGTLEARVGFDQESNLTMIGYYGLGEQKPFVCRPE